MKLEKIITMANATVAFRFRIMERSLRAVGCQLPLYVIPYDENRFELPIGASWLEDSEFFKFLAKEGCRGVFRKYLCLFQENYLFVDSDIVFLQNPQNVLEPYKGFITSCGHWHNPDHTTSKESVILFKKHSTTWQKQVFNSGQFASSASLFSRSAIRSLLIDDQYRYTLLDFPYHEQPGMNLLVLLSAIEVTNLTLPPIGMESTWAGDYPLGADLEQLWHSAKKPFLIHWAGCDIKRKLAVDDFFEQYLTNEEKIEWAEMQQLQQLKMNKEMNSLKGRLRSIKRYFR